MKLEPSHFGLKKAELLKIIQVLEAFPEIDEASFFGSRALGTFKPGSDIDIVLYGSSLGDNITRISYLLQQETTLPYFFDILDYHEISNPELKQHIDRVGQVFYKHGFSL